MIFVAALNQNHFSLEETLRSGWLFLEAFKVGKLTAYLALKLEARGLCLMYGVCNAE